jgi:hypothetical protein
MRASQDTLPVSVYFTTTTSLDPAEGVVVPNELPFALYAVVVPVVSPVMYTADESTARARPVSVLIDETRVNHWTVPLDEYLTRKASVAELAGVVKVVPNAVPDALYAVITADVPPS